MGTLKNAIMAGMAGTAALNATNYLDVAIRGRAPSRTPEQSVQRMADAVGVSLGHDEHSAGNRKAGMGPLIGYATGVATAVTFAQLVGRRRVPWPVAALGLTTLAMLAANAPMTALGITDPRRWSAADWAADVIPHLAYGAAAAAVMRGQQP